MARPTRYTEETLIPTLNQEGAKVLERICEIFTRRNSLRFCTWIFSVATSVAIFLMLLNRLVLAYTNITPPPEKIGGEMMMYWFYARLWGGLLITCSTLVVRLVIWHMFLGDWEKNLQSKLEEILKDYPGFFRELQMMNSVWTDAIISFLPSDTDFFEW